MKEDLNLLPSRAKFQAVKIKLKKKISYFMWLGGGLWLAAVVGLFGFWLVLKLGLEAETKDYKKLLAQYQSMEESAVASERLKYKSKLVSQVLEGRFEYGDSLRRMAGLFPVEVKLNRFELRERNSFEVGGVISDGAGMDKLEEIVEKIKRGQLEGFESIELRSLEVDSGVWQFSAEVKTL